MFNDHYFPFSPCYIVLPFSFHHSPFCFACDLNPAKATAIKFLTFLYCVELCPFFAVSCEYNGFHEAHNTSHAPPSQPYLVLPFLRLFLSDSICFPISLILPPSPPLHSISIQKTKAVQSSIVVCLLVFRRDCSTIQNRLLSLPSRD